MNQNVLELIAHYCNNDQIACLFRHEVITEQMAIRAAKFEYPKGECKGCWFYLFSRHHYSHDEMGKKIYNFYNKNLWSSCALLYYYADGARKNWPFRDL